MSEVAEPVDAARVDAWNRSLAALDTAGRIRHALQHLPGSHAVTSSFGPHAAVTLHLLTGECPEIPVILLDTGYLLPETYHFIEDLTGLLGLDLKVYSSRRSPAWQEAAEGQRWTLGVAGHHAYHRENRVEPLQRAFADLGVGTWFTGQRGGRAAGTGKRPFVRAIGPYLQVRPIADWSDADVDHYLRQHQLPRHPLWQHTASWERSSLERWERPSLE